MVFLNFCAGPNAPTLNVSSLGTQRGENACLCFVTPKQDQLLTDLCNLVICFCVPTVGHLLQTLGLGQDVLTYCRTAENGLVYFVAQLDALVFVFRFLQLSNDCAGLNRQDRSLRNSGAPKIEPFHRAARQSTVSNRSESTNVRSGHQNTELQCTRMAIAPNVDRKHRHHTGHINARSNVINTAALSPLDS